MENKLQQLTEKLYNDGLSKGKQEGEAILAKAKDESKAIVEAAQKEATLIIEKARKDAQQLENTTKSEITLAAGQMMSALKQQIAGVVTAGVFEEQIKAAYSDSSFVKELIVKAVERFDVNSNEGVKVIVPEGFDSVVKAAVAEKLGKGVEIVSNAKVKVPFRIAPKDGSYVVSFSADDFDALFKSYIRPMVEQLLFK